MEPPAQAGGDAGRSRGEALLAFCLWARLRSSRLDPSFSALVHCCTGCTSWAFHPCCPVLLQITIQTINCTFYLIPNAYVMTHDCAWFDPVVIWSGFVRCALTVLGRTSHSACAGMWPVPGKQQNCVPGDS